MKQGFTLIELLTVILIIGILGSIAVPQYRESIERSRVTEVKEMLPAIYDAIDRYKVESEDGAEMPTFSKLDISLKGKQNSTDPRKWETSQFIYTIACKKQLDHESNVGHLSVWGIPKKGKYKESIVIFYDGEELICHPYADSDGCEKFNIDKFPPFTAFADSFPGC